MFDPLNIQDKCFVLVPCSEFNEILDKLRDISVLLSSYSQLPAQYDALKSMQVEMLEKIADIERNL